MLDFSYSSPYPNFDRSKVKGLVVSLITLDPADYPRSAAPKISAGAKSYNVVVEDEKFGKDLQHGKLKKRVTMIPLNKVKTFGMSAQVSLFVPSSLRNTFTLDFHILLQKLQSATHLEGISACHGDLDSPVQRVK